MSTVRILATSIAWFVISASVVSAQDLSSYREFHLGASLVTVAEQAGITPEGRVLHNRPGLMIQELMWLPPMGALRQADSASKVVFNGYNGQLFRIVVTYSRNRTEGLTVEDMIDALSVQYGRATLPSGEIRSSQSGVSASSDETLASWEDSEYSARLFRSFYPSTYGLVVLSKPLDALAKAAMVEAVRLDEEQAPQREIDRQLKEGEANRVREDKAREMNKPTFRP